MSNSDLNPHEHPDLESRNEAESDDKAHLPSSLEEAQTLLDEREAAETPMKSSFEDDEVGIDSGYNTVTQPPGSAPFNDVKDYRAHLGDLDEIAIPPSLAKLYSLQRFRDNEDASDDNAKRSTFSLVIREKLGDESRVRKTRDNDNVVSRSCHNISIALNDNIDGVVASNGGSPMIRRYRRGNF